MGQLFNVRLPAEEKRGMALQEDVRRLRDALTAATDGKDNAPVFLRECLRLEVWKQTRVFAGGTRQEPISFDEFVSAPYPVGLGINYATLYDYAGADPELADLLGKVTGANAGAMGASAHPVRHYRVSEIRVGDRLRTLNEDSIAALAGSINKIGLQVPISVIAGEGDDGPLLVAGNHRLEACRRLGIEWIPCVIHADEREARLWEIAENLHRAELTALERSEHIAEWVRLVGDKPGQNVRVSGGRGIKGGISEAARTLPVDGDNDEARRANVRRAVKVASLAEEAKDAAREAGIDDNQSALMRVAKEKSAQEQLAAVRREEQRKKRIERQRENRKADRALALETAEEFAEWLVGRTDPGEMPQVLAWLGGCKPKDVISAIRRQA